MLSSTWAARASQSKKTGARRGPVGTISAGRSSVGGGGAGRKTTFFAGKKTRDGLFRGTEITRLCRFQGTEGTRLRKLGERRSPVYVNSGNGGHPFVKVRFSDFVGARI